MEEFKIPNALLESKGQGNYLVGEGNSLQGTTWTTIGSIGHELWKGS